MLHKNATKRAYGSMAKQTPYLQRRGDTFSFRIAVPSELRQIIGKREYIKSLHTTDKRIAIPMALRLAATAKQLFNEIPRNMSNPNKLRQPIVKKASERLPDDEDELEEGEGLRIDYSFEIDLDEFRSPKRIRVQAEPHEQEAVNSAIKTALEHAQTRSPPQEHNNPIPTIKNASEARGV